MMQKRQLCFLLLIVVCCSASDEECKCSKIPTGKWAVTFTEVVVPGYKKSGNVVLKHRYNEVFYGSVKVNGFLPMTWFPLEFAGYLDGTSCRYRGSMAFVPARLTLVFDLLYDNDKTMIGTYNRATAIGVDDHFAEMTLKLVEADDGRADELEDVEFDEGMRVAVF